MKNIMIKIVKRKLLFELKLSYLYDKWIKGECRHLCIFCDHHKRCMREYFIMR